jgi:hypothetical protein
MEAQAICARHPLPTPTALQLGMDEVSAGTPSRSAIGETCISLRVTADWRLGSPSQPPTPQPCGSQAINACADIWGLVPQAGPGGGGVQIWQAVTANAAHRLLVQCAWGCFAHHPKVPNFHKLGVARRLSCVGKILHTFWGD